MERGVKIDEFIKMALDFQVFRPDEALMVLPYMGSLIHVTMCHVFQTSNTKVGNFSLSLFASMHTIIINLLNLLFGFKISQNFIGLLEDLVTHL
jgi:hypothetical protein